MGVNHLTEYELERDNRWLFETVTRCLDVVARLLTENEASVPCVPRVVAGYVVPYSFSGKIRLLFEYARGKKKLSRSLVEEITLEFHHMMTLDVMGSIAEEEEDDDVDDAGSEDSALQEALKVAEALLPHAIAKIIIASNGRAKAERGEWLNALEMQCLSGISADRASINKIRTKTQDGVELYNPEDVLRTMGVSEDVAE
ncbi:MAG: hypothetical protein II767_02230 [Proteobacteria bacterium]|nr:hypothetical protein [Pseudomonadota bacterium]